MGVVLYLFLIKISLVLSYDNNSTCVVSNSDNICKDIILMGRYIHAGRVVINLLLIILNTNI